MHRFVFDTDVIIAAMRSPSGASAALLGAVLDRRGRASETRSFAGRGGLQGREEQGRLAGREAHKPGEAGPS